MSFGMADRRNRKAMGEIRNLPTVRGIEVKPNRPISRNSRVQLLANVQAAAANDNSKKQVCVTVNGVTSVLDKHVTRAVAPNVVQKKAVKVNVKPKEVIPICLDTVEGLVKKVNLKRKKVKVSKK